MYLRLPDGTDIASIPAGVLEDCAQLVKHNSIEGNRTNGVVIVYTPWANLRKSGDMATGQVGFHSPKLVRRTRVEKRDNAIVNRLNKTKSEAFPDLAAEKEAHLRAVARAAREVRFLSDGGRRRGSGGVDGWKGGSRAACGRLLLPRGGSRGCACWLLQLQPIWAAVCGTRRWRGGSTDAHWAGVLLYKPIDRGQHASRLSLRHVLTIGPCCYFWYMAVNWLAGVVLYA